MLIANIPEHYMDNIENELPIVITKDHVSEVNDDIDIKKTIDGLQFTVDMFLFDPSTGVVKEKEQLNDLDRTTVDACENAIRILKAIGGKKNE